MESHKPVVLLTVLPAERRARHPYQLCTMIGLILLSGSQLLFGAVPSSAVASLSQNEQNLLNWYSLFGGLAGVTAAIIPERVISWQLRKRTHDFDATWIRLWVELGCHGLLFFVWASYLVAVTAKISLVQGLTLGTSFVLMLAAAAVWRALQILWTIKRAVIDPPETSGIVGAETIETVFDDDDNS